MAKKSTKLEALNAIFEENGINKGDIPLHADLIHALKKNADAIPDYRHPSYIWHLVGDIVMIVFFALLGNADEWGEIESFARQKEKWLRKYLELPHGIPTDDTIRIVMGNIDTGHFFRLAVGLLLETVDGIVRLSGKETHEKEIVCVDGKESCGSRRRDTGNGEVRALQTLNVYAGDYGICIGQKFIEEKTNEIPAAQELLPLLDLKDCIVTADAMNCQKGTVSAIVKAGGDYVLALKGNQPLFYQEVAEYFDSRRQEELRQEEGRWYKTVEKEHGGVAIREYYITEDVGWYSEKEKWEKLRAFGMVKKRLEGKDGRVNEEFRHYICSIEADAREFARSARGHWKVENNLHWQLDFTFRDDKNKSMAKTGAKNLQTMKKIVMAILNMVKAGYKLSMKRIRYELSLDYENEAERLLSMLDINAVKEVLDSKGKSSQK
ncbi:MAG: ISAs1 family transposase [Butyrivibrio sp.]|nr:ISAs1 family transposase [Butyrivibrio sp.]